MAAGADEPGRRRGRRPAGAARPLARRARRRRTCRAGGRAARGRLVEPHVPGARRRARLGAPPATPAGPRLATAHDMGREHRVQAALGRPTSPSPRRSCACADEAVIGVPFYVMERLDGVVYDDVDAVAELTRSRDSRRRSSWSTCSRACTRWTRRRSASADFGRPAGYLQRQVAAGRPSGRSRRRSTCRTVDEVARRLERGAPRREPPRASCTATTASTTRCTGPTTRPACRRCSTGSCRRSATRSPTSARSRSTGTRSARSCGAAAQPQAHRANAGFPDVDTLLERYAATSGTDLALHRLLPGLRHLQARGHRTGRRAAHRRRRPRTPGSGDPDGRAARRPRARAHPDL